MCVSVCGVSARSLTQTRIFSYSPQKRTFEKDPDLFVDEYPSDTNSCDDEPAGSPKGAGTLTYMQAQISKYIIRNGGTCPFDRLSRTLYSQMYEQYGEGGSLVVGGCVGRCVDVSR